LSVAPISPLPLTAAAPFATPSAPSAETEARERRLLEWLGGAESAIVAFSGGVDSAYVLWAAHRALGARALAVIGRSDTYARAELEFALAEAGRIGAPVRVVATAELADPRFRDNAPDRCYHCKDELYGKLETLARSQGYALVLDGTNADDLADHRPGRRAAGEHGVRSPLAELGFAKSEIRMLARSAGLASWDKPAMPCLSSRFPYGMRITAEKLHQVEEAEAWLRGRGFRECRVRHHGDVARIEVPAADIARLAVEAPLRDSVVRALGALGFPFVAVDLAGFRSGSLNSVLAEGERERVGAGGVPRSRPEANVEKRES
jgi:uncharacterized protein